MASDDPTHPPGPGRRSILFVCTGNTCRSPLAEALCKKLLADRLGVAPEALPAQGFEVRSAGVMAAPGDPPSSEADLVAREYGTALADHRSRPVDPELLAAATDVVAMTAAHAAVLRMRFPTIGPDPVLLAGDGDLPDPIGGSLDVYRECAAVIADHLDRLFEGWLGK